MKASFVEGLGARILVGYILWDTKTNSPHHGTRRFKVWTTEKEASHGWTPEYMQKYGLEVREAWVDGP